jgi:hypothetical protein
MEAFGCSAGSRGLRHVPLGVSYLRHGDAKLGEHGDKHQDRRLVLAAHSRPSPGTARLPGAASSDASNA